MCFSWTAKLLCGTAGDNNVNQRGPGGSGSSGNAVVGGAGGDGGDDNGNFANGGDDNDGDFSGNGGFASGDNGNGGNGGTGVGGEPASALFVCVVCSLASVLCATLCLGSLFKSDTRSAAGWQMYLICVSTLLEANNIMLRELGVWQLECTLRLQLDDTLGY